jgi:hypothetical protein
MSIEDLILRTVTQTAVYWGNPQPDGYGGETFDDPIEIDCRWEDATELNRSDVIREFITKAIVYVTQDLDVNGWLYLGSLTDSGLDSNPDNPREVDGAYIIGRFDKIPNIRGTEYVRKAYIGWQRVA